MSPAARNRESPLSWGCGSVEMFASVNEALNVTPSTVKPQQKDSLQIMNVEKYVLTKDIC